MPSGIVLKSASHEVSEEVREANLKAVIKSAGYEVQAPEPETPAEPKREDFKTEEEFEAATVEYQEKQEAAAEEAESGEEEEELEAERPAVKKGSYKDRKNRAIARATAEKDRKIKELEEQLAANKKPAAAEPAAAPKQEPRPKRADFEAGDAGQEAYEDALLSWNRKKVIAETARENAEAAQRARFEENARSYAEQVAVAKAKYADWDKVVDQPIFIGPETQLTIFEQENAAEVIYYLGKHPAEAKKLGEIYREHGAISAIREAEKLSLSLLAGTDSSAPDEDEGEEKPKRVKPKVPAPVRTVNTGGSSSGASFAEISARPNYPGKLADLKRAQAEGR